MIRNSVKWFAAMALLAAAALPAAAQTDTVCGVVQCSASGLRPQMLRESTRTAQAKSPNAMSSATFHDAQRAQPARDAWDRHILGRANQEAYNCALSFGIGGELAKQGFLGTRVLGKTQVWNTPAGDTGR
jgi:uncharacterized protein (DUF2147 family)